jgi:hypothetical protein
MQVMQCVAGNVWALPLSQTPPDIILLDLASVSATEFGIFRQVFVFYGNNHLQHYIDGTTVDVCPNCGCTPECSTHIIFCRSPDRSTVYSSSVDKFVEWLSSQRTDPDFTVLLSHYLRARGQAGLLLLCTGLLLLCTPFSQYRELATVVNDLGFRSMLEGRIPKNFFDERQLNISCRGLRKHAVHWCNGLILRLLQITHRQWTFWNGTIHLRGPDGLTISQRDLLSCKCEDLLWTDPSTLLEDDRYLLDIDFRSLGDAPTATRQAWLAETEAACSAATSGHLASEPLSMMVPLHNTFLPPATLRAVSDSVDDTVGNKRTLNTASV